MSNETVLDPPAELHEVNPVSEAARKLNALSQESKRRAAAEAASKPTIPDEHTGHDSAQTATQVDGYVTERIACVRAHLTRLDGQLEAATTAQDVERIARAIAALSETERKLAGRPDPGSRRPGKERERTAAREVHPI